jgi:hypothetical protein
MNYRKDHKGHEAVSMCTHMLNAFVRFASFAVES